MNRKRHWQQKLLAWYGRHARDLPWRRTSDPYAVWVSEIMLQQTQVSTVIPYFESFMTRFPTVFALANAPEADVLRQWEGLGYYRRARQLHRAAEIVVADHNGVVPSDQQIIETLPGIGRYTAGAIRSIAYAQRAPILEANTLRLLSRLILYRGDLQSAAGRKLLWQTAEDLLPTRNPGTFNQALMELGSQVCVPQCPRCDRCPLGGCCAARAHHLVDQIPKGARKPQVERVNEAAVVIGRGGKILLIERGENERWAGMWDFPRFALKAPSGHASNREIEAQVAQISGLKIRVAAHLATLRHTVTRFRITLECFEAVLLDSTESTARNGSHRAKWFKLDALDAIPLSVTGRKLARLFMERSAGPGTNRRPRRAGKRSVVTQKPVDG